MIRLSMTASSIGGSIGTGFGTSVGKAIGSLEGMTSGRTDGAAAGKAAGLSAEDTVAMITGEFKSVENLEVLVASVKLKNFHTIGKQADYAVLYLVNGSIIFSVDLSQATIEKKNDTVQVKLPRPKGTLYLDARTRQKVAEYQKSRFTGSAEDGLDARLNSMAKVQEASENTLENYSVLLDAAKTAAEKQVDLLVQSVSVGGPRVVVKCEA